MKKILIIMGVVLSFFLVDTAVSIAATTSKQVVVLKRNSNDHDIKEKPPKGLRTPSRPITAIISETEGVTVPGYDEADFLSYSAYNEQEECIGVFYDGVEFASFVLNAPSVIEIRIELEDGILIGYIQ